ncbi:ferrous iron transport protein A [Desulfococcus sp.]|uniref:FeoA family protein n=1 Tax=Desulfococcus sp. TaxID=2025834 RepID=UPI003593CB40
MVLREILSGERAKLLAVDGGCNLQCRLAGMGLVPGMEVRMISNIPGRPVILETYGARLTLCQKMASRIRVLKADGAAAAHLDQQTARPPHPCQAPSISEPGVRCPRRLCCLRQMQVNQTGTIRSVKAEGELGRRIRDMGLIPNTEVTVVGRAPLKDPVALRLRDFTLSLRNNEADFITVEIAGGGCDEDAEHCACG